MNSQNDCLFCRLASNCPSNLIVYECSDLIAFLDILPIRESHTQIVTKNHYNYFEELPKSISHKIIDLGQRIAKAQKELYPVERAGFLFTGSDIAHVHAHVLPLFENTDITSLRYPHDKKRKFGGAEKASTVSLEKTTAMLKAQLER